MLAKKAALAHPDPPTTLTYAEALDEALCHGWIDGQARRRDELTVFQRYTPRHSRSPWSARNVGYVARLVDEGRMQAAGLAEVERAKADGRWEAAYAGPATAEVPGSLLQAVPGKDASDTKLRLSMTKEELKAAAAFEPYQPPRPVSSQNAPTRPMGAPAPTTPKSSTQ